MVQLVFSPKRLVKRKFLLALKRKKKNYKTYKFLFIQFMGMVCTKKIWFVQRSAHSVACITATKPYKAKIKEKVAKKLNFCHISMTPSPQCAATEIMTYPHHVTTCHADGSMQRPLCQHYNTTLWHATTGKVWLNKKGSEQQLFGNMQALLPCFIALNFYFLIAIFFVGSDFLRFANKLKTLPMLDVALIRQNYYYYYYYLHY